MKKAGSGDLVGHLIRAAEAAARCPGQFPAGTLKDLLSLLWSEFYAAA